MKIDGLLILILTPHLIIMIKLSKLANNARLTMLPRFLFSTFADPYYILGVDKNAPYPEIKKAFYRLANEFHPDKNDTQVSSHRFRSKLSKSS